MDTYGFDSTQSGDFSSPLDATLAAGNPAALPLYYRAADSHTIGNNAFALTDPSTYGSGLDSTSKFLLSAAYSGFNGFRNTGVAIGNFFGADLQEHNTAQDLADIDNDLGAYYVRNRGAADVVGFITSSLVPGIGGIKLLNAGQKALTTAVRTGTVGGNIGRAVGLMRPLDVGLADVSAATAFATLAGQRISRTQASFSRINSDTLNALASGVGQNALEGAAFEIAVQATMAKSPVLEEQDGWDIAKNIAVGAGLSGVIGGAFSAAKTFSTQRRAVNVTEELEKPFTFQKELPAAATAGERLVLRVQQLESTPAVAVVSSDANQIPKLTRQRSEKLDSLNTAIRSDLHSMTVGGDADLGNHIADLMRGTDARQIEANFLHSTEMGRMSAVLETEKAAAAAVKRNPEASRIAAETGAASSTRGVQYVKLIGEDSGSIFNEAPKVLSLADTIKPGTSVEAGIEAAVKKFGFSSKTLWDAAAKASPLEAEARYIWTQSVKISDNLRIHANDIPMQERILAEWQKQAKTPGLVGAIKTIRTVNASGTESLLVSPDELMAALRIAKSEVSAALLASGKVSTLDGIAAITNVKKSWLAGERSMDEARDIFAKQDWDRVTTERLIANGSRSALAAPVNTHLMPNWVKIGYDLNPVLDENGMIISGASYLTAKAKGYMQAVHNVTAKHMQELFIQFPKITTEALHKTTRFGAGPGTISFAGGKYGSIEATMEQAGKVTSMLQEKFKKVTRTSMQSPGYQLANKQEAALEFESIRTLTLSSAEYYIPNEAGDALILRSIYDYQKAIAEGATGLRTPAVQSGVPLEIPIKHEETRAMILALVDRNGQRVSGEIEMRAAQGLENHKDPRVFYPPRENLSDYPHFAFVVDPTVSSGAFGHVKMIHAASAKQLEEMLDRVPTNYDTITKGQSERFHKAMQDYEYDKTLHESHIDADLKRAGVNSPFFPKTDASKIVNDVIQDQLRRDDIFARELVNAHYEPQFKELRNLGQPYADIETSKYGPSFRFAENKGYNPYLSYMKTALNLQQTNDSGVIKLMTGLNNTVSETYARVMRPINDAFAQVRNPAELDAINAQLARAGIKTAYYDAALNLLANHSAGKQALGQFVARANAVLANVVLQLDPLNAINNAFGANVLRYPEYASVFAAIKRGDSENYGKLTALKDVIVPGTNGSTITSPAKLIASSMARMRDPELQKFYRENGFLDSISDDINAVLDAATLTGRETAQELAKREGTLVTLGKKLVERGTVWTGNKFSEQMNKFLSVDPMKQLTDILIARGEMSADEALSYMRTAFNRTEGNHLASQRPLLFQGPVGQAIGLFQTYQFNLMQQLFRHVGEGSAKDSAMLLGLQSTIYGMNGLPAFNYINTHIVGTASGNPKHRDIYSSTYGIFGKNVGDWLIYGAASNLLHTNLYTRGDINPRQLTVIPTNPADIPIINATSKFFGNIKNTLGKIANGGAVWETILQGIEHNGLSRPLAGMAQIAQASVSGGYGFSTSNQGNMLGANDLFTLATLARLAGGKPMDEAIANDATFRMSVYQSHDSALKSDLNEAIKSAVIGGQVPDTAQYTKFAASYAALGGKQKQFNKYILRLTVDANTPQSEKIASDLRSSYSQNMQSIMDGRSTYDQADW